MSKGIIRNVIMVIVFIVCLALIIIGQKNISAADRIGRSADPAVYL